MSVEHANQLRQLIVEKHRPQPAGLANVYSLIIIYYSQCTIRQPKVIFPHMPAGKHKKIYFMRQPVPVTILRSLQKVILTATRSVFCVFVIKTTMLYPQNVLIKITPFSMN